MRLLCLLLLLGTGPAFACGVLEPDEQRRRDKQDVALQMQLAEALARQADAVFIGQVVKVHDAESLADVTVERVLKGKPDKSLRLPANDLKGLTVSCWASDMFRNSQVGAARRHLLSAGWHGAPGRVDRARRRRPIASEGSAHCASLQRHLTMCCSGRRGRRTFQPTTAARRR